MWKTCLWKQSWRQSGQSQRETDRRVWEKSAWPQLKKRSCTKWQSSEAYPVLTLWLKALVFIIRGNSTAHLNTACSLQKHSIHSAVNAGTRRRTKWRHWSFTQPHTHPKKTKLRSFCIEYVTQERYTHYSRSVRQCSRKQAETYVAENKVINFIIFFRISAWLNCTMLDDDNKNIWVRWPL